MEEERGEENGRRDIKIGRRETGQKEGDGTGEEEEERGRKKRQKERRGHSASNSP